MDAIFELNGYEKNREYEKLADMMLTQSVVCILDYGKDCRDVAHTLWNPTQDGRGIWQLSARGVTYIYAWDRNDFIGQCARQNVDIIFPNTRMSGH